jgi:hypothetical protein
LSRFGKRLLIAVCIAYLAFIVWFGVSVYRNRGTIIVPRMASVTRGGGSVAGLADLDDRRIDELAAQRLRPRQEMVLGNRKIAADDTRPLDAEDWRAIRDRARKDPVLKEFAVWDPRFILEKAAKKYILYEEPTGFQNRLKRTVTPEGEPIIILDEDNLVLLAKSYRTRNNDYAPVTEPDEAGRDGFHARVRVVGRGEQTGINLTSVFMALNFLALFAILYALLWEPITKLLDERAAGIKKQVDDARADRAEAERLRAEQEQQRSATDRPAPPPADDSHR